MNKLAIGVGAVSLALSGCATTGEQTAVQRAVGQCAFAIGGGALIGAVIGNNVGSGDAGAGAVVGAVAGAGACGFLLYRASEEDKARIRELELAALDAPKVGRTVETFTAENGKDEVRVETFTEEAPEEDYPEVVLAAYTPDAEIVPAQETVVEAEAGGSEQPVSYTNCRYVTQSITIEDDQVDGNRQLTCRTTTGDWVNF
ncbi:MAG: hypothetical protein AAGH87_04565 [Pseudomonadota bacterium]